MKKISFMLMGFLFSLLVEEQSLASQFRSLDYDGIRDEGGFNSPSLSNVTDLYPGGRNLNEAEIEGLVTSASLKSLRTLDLRNQPIVNDDVIARLARNPTFSRILTIKLSGTNITDEAIARIVSSPHLGSVRDLPQISGRFGVPSSEVKVYTKDTQVVDTKQRTSFEFHIEYRPPNPGNYPWDPVDHGVKIVEIESW